MKQRQFNKMKLQEKCKTKNCNLDRLYKNNEIVQMFANFRIYVKAKKKKEKHKWQIVYKAVRMKVCEIELT